MLGVGLIFRGRTFPQPECRSGFRSWQVANLPGGQEPSGGRSDPLLLPHLARLGELLERDRDGSQMPAPPEGLGAPQRRRFGGVESATRGGGGATGGRLVVHVSLLLFPTLVRVGSVY